MQPSAFSSDKAVSQYFFHVSSYTLFLYSPYPLHSLQTVILFMKGNVHSLFLFHMFSDSEPCLTQKACAIRCTFNIFSGLFIQSLSYTGIWKHNFPTAEYPFQLVSLITIISVLFLFIFMSISWCIISKIICRSECAHFLLSLLRNFVPCKY